MPNLEGHRRGEMLVFSAKCGAGKSVVGNTVWAVESKTHDYYEFTEAVAVCSTPEKAQERADG